MDDLRRKRVIFVTGKGGVGRTTVAAAMGVAAAKLGRRAVIAEIGEPGEFSLLARLFDRQAFGVHPETVAPNLSCVCLHSTHGHEKFLEKVLVVPALAHAGMRSRALRRLFDTAPSLVELGIFYHFFSLVKETRNDGSFANDLVIIDMPATGHALALTSLPDRVLALMPVGPIADTLREGQAVAEDPAQTAAWVVTLPEVLPVSESLELLEGLWESRFPVGGVLVNKVMRDDFDADERAVVEQMIAKRPLYGANRYRSLAQVDESLQRLRKQASVPVRVIPEYTSTGRALVDAVADALVRVNGEAR